MENSGVLLGGGRTGSRVEAGADRHREKAVEVEAPFFLVGRFLAVGRRETARKCAYLRRARREPERDGLFGLVLVGRRVLRERGQRDERADQNPG